MSEHERFTMDTGICYDPKAHHLAGQSTCAMCDDSHDEDHLYTCDHCARKICDACLAKGQYGWVTCATCEDDGTLLKALIDDRDSEVWQYLNSVLTGGQITAVTILGDRFQTVHWDYSVPGKPDIAICMSDDKVLALCREDKE